ncbi:MAG TPA: hypothetical protein VHX63_02515 [Acidobacteriaceae bacterium]|jgi:hypothetical protein|nr:hypothetical protein [Acidobacteriaceae bacterium]
MTTIEAEKKDLFYAAFVAPGRSPEIPESEDIYGWLIGSWKLDVLYYRADVAVHQIKGEAHFAWTLEGRAIQDVWIMPRRATDPERFAELKKFGNLYGITLRVWDAAIRAWRITWINPVTGWRDEMMGHRSGNDVVQVGAHADGTPIRWRFTEITPGSFHWIGEALQPDGKTWKLEGEFRARRMG